MRATLVFLALILATRANGHDIAASVFSDRKTLERFISAPEVTAQRLFLKKSPNGLMAGDPRQLSCYTTGPAVAVSKAAAQQLRTLFTSDSSFLWHSEPKNDVISVRPCLPDYGVLIKFRGDAGVVSIALCFKCDLFAVFWGDGNEASRINAEEEFDLIRPQLVALVEQLFSDDPTIQSLKSVHAYNGT